MEFCDPNKSQVMAIIELSRLMFLAGSDALSHVGSLT